MTNLTRAMGLALFSLLITACSSTTMSGSWADTNYVKHVKKVYIIGVTEDKTNRHIFEDTFGRQLATQGIKSVPSYINQPNNLKTDHEAILKLAATTGCDSILLTKLISTRTETVSTNPRVSGYSSAPSYYGGGFYNNWDRYNNRGHEIIFTPATTADFVILTIESSLYDLKTDKIIWAGQLETVVKGSLIKMVEDFAKIVNKDLKEKGLI